MSSIQTVLAAGDIAHDFQVTDIFDNPIHLQALQGRPVLLSFYRNSACALCNLRVHELIQRYPYFEEHGLQILAIFESPAANTHQYVGKQDAPFPIIADPEGQLYDLYGIEVSPEIVGASMSDEHVQTVVQQAAAAGFQLTREEGSNFYRIPADFLIHPDGSIHTAYYPEQLGMHIPFATIEQFLETL